MPGPVSDNYDPEWGTAANGDFIRDQLKSVYGVVSGVLGMKPPMYIVDLAQDPGMGNAITATLSEKQWRLIRFALERADESI